MATIDIIFIGILLFSTLLGAFRGFVYEILSIVGWLASFVVARFFAESVGLWLPLNGARSAVQHFVGFVVVFVVSFFAFGLFSWSVKKWIGASALRPADRTLGGIFGIARGWAILVLVALAMTMSPWFEALWWREAQMVPVLEHVAEMIKPLLPEQIRDFSPMARQPRLTAPDALPLDLRLESPP
jgi:membrane protein required for colicin V production